MAYATRRDLYKYGLARGTLAMKGQLVESALAATDLITLDGHGFEDDETVLVRATEGGTLPAPLVEGTLYYVRRISDSTLKLSETAGGAPIDLTTDGDQMLIAAPLPVDDILEFYSRFADPFIPAHAVPLEEPYPVTVVAIVAELAAKKLMALAGQQSVSVDQAEIAAKAQLERWASGLPIRDARVTSATNCAVTSTLATTSDPRGWNGGDSGRIP